MRGATAALRSDDFEVWAAAARPRLVVAFFLAEELSMAEARSLIDETLREARRQWSTVCGVDDLNTTWAYQTAFRLLDERRVAGSAR